MQAILAEKFGDVDVLGIDTVEDSVTGAGGRTGGGATGAPRRSAGKIVLLTEGG
ncbi:MAG: hypothetical protein ACKVIA_09315 [Rhodobacterales bacterium]|jgi:hypothetical protein